VETSHYFANALGLEWDDGWVTAMKALLLVFSHLKKFITHSESSSSGLAELESYSTYRRGYSTDI